MTPYGANDEIKGNWGNFGKPQKHKESGWEKFFHITSPISNLHSGGYVKKTGLHRLRKGELVLTVKQQREIGIKKGRNKKVNAHKRVATKG